MKRILSFAIVLFISGLTYGQTPFENPSFETWDGFGTPEEEPTQYSSLKTADQLGGSAPQVLWQSTDAHSGSYSAYLKVAPYNWLAGVSPNGIMTNGQVHAEFVAANGYVFTHPDSSKWNTPCTNRPDSLVGWYKYAPQGGDKGKVQILLHDDTQEGRLPSNGTTSHWVGHAKYEITAAQASWTRFSIPVTYLNNNYPDYILLVAAAGDSTLSVDGTELWLDDIELIYNPLSVTISPAATQNIDIGVNGTTLTATETTSANVTTAITREWKYSTTSGGPYSSFAPAETGTTYTPNFASAGIYYVVCETNFGVSTEISNEVEIVVIDPNVNTVTISPSTTQTLLSNTNGNVLTANETPSAATSREWMYSTTSGSGYVSFAPAETGTTYTPNFANLGTYYVICESDFAGDVQTSNEVVIIVNGNAGIQQNGIEFHVYFDGVYINIQQSGLSGISQFELFTLDGKQVFTQNFNEINSKLQPGNLNGVYIYRVISGNTIITGKLKL
ncbi:MAG: PCMD domain-containing protein [Crocinitomicaceae bacterium]|nr:PCMD domain-containing protein [Crocinitomicaceae bacterium]